MAPNGISKVMQSSFIRCEVRYYTRIDILPAFFRKVAMGRKRRGFGITVHAASNCVCITDGASSP